jgi:hypothetical protein
LQSVCDSDLNKVDTLSINIKERIMKAYCNVIGAVSFCLAFQNGFAQSSPVSPESAADSNSLRFGGEVQGFISSPPGADLLRNAIKNPDGSRTIKSGHQTPEANELNRKFCESLGARDVTNESDVTLGPGTTYGGVCSGFSGPRPGPSVQAIPGAGTGRIFLPVPDNQPGSALLPDVSTRMPLQIVPPPINGSSPFAVQYYAAATVDFYNMPSRNVASTEIKVYENSVPFKFSTEQLLGPGYGNIYSFVICTPATPRASTTVTGCFPGAACVSAQGVISHY